MSQLPLPLVVGHKWSIDALWEVFEFMDDTQFWSLIAKSKQDAEDCEDQAERLRTLLTLLTPEEIYDFDRHFARRRVESYRWDLWAVAYIVNGGCSDDGFEYFCCWLIGQGQQVFEAALASPSTVSELILDEELAVECEDLLYAASEAYEQVAGKEIPTTDIVYPKEPAGDAWAEEDLLRLYPDLCKRFWGE